jgi:hypothetical protein
MWVKGSDMTRESKVGLLAVAAVVGLIGWSVAEGIANRPRAADVRTVVTPERELALDRANTPEPSGKACCKDKADHADHSSCKMKDHAVSSPPPTDSAKCPYLAGTAAPAAAHVRNDE